MNITKKKNNIPLRRCMVTGEQLPKSSLLRMVKTPDNQLLIDLTGRMNGRGAYIKKDGTLISPLIKGRHIQKQFGLEPSEAFIAELTKAMHG